MPSALPRVPLSVLDTAPIGESSSPAAVLGATRALARHVEGLGFTRYWAAEHHNAPSIAASSPAVVAAALGEATTRLRIGTGGILLPNHAPLIAAEQLGTLAALFPGRVDFGIGRATPDPYVTAALGRAPQPDFPHQVEDLLGYLTAGSTGVAYKGVVPAPGFTGRPALWLLGSSTYSGTLAAQLGMPFAFAHHFRPDNTLAALETYRKSFRPSAILDRPYAIIAVQVICGEDDAAAVRLAAPAALAFIRMQSAPPTRLPTFAAAEAYPWSTEELKFREQMYGSQAVGSPDTVRDRLTDILDATGADELTITTIVPDGGEMIRSMDRIRGLFGDAELPLGLAV